MKFLLLPLGLSLALSACSGPSPSRTPPVVETETTASPNTGPTSYAILGHAGPATLAALAIRHNPRLQALRFRAARLAEKVAQRESLPDPSVSRTAGARLNALLNRPAGTTLPGVSERPMESPGNLPDLLARASAAHPEVLSATHKVEAFKARLQRARLEKYPDLTFGVQNAAVSSSGLAPSANGRDQIFGTLGFKLPLWQKPRLAMVREAKAGLAETESLLSSTRADLRYRIEDAYFRAQTAREVARLFLDRLIPDSRQAYEVTLTSYAAGETSFLAVIDSWLEWLTYQLQYAQNRAQLGKAIATLRAAAGPSPGDSRP